jgi:hypothetical protein
MTRFGRYIKIKARPNTTNKLSLKMDFSIIHVQSTLIVSNSVESNLRLSRIFIEVPNFVVMLFDELFLHCQMVSIRLHFLYVKGHWIFVNIFYMVMVFNDTFNNISAISWRSVFMVRGNRSTRENHQPAASHWQTWSHNVASITPFHWSKIVHPRASLHDKIWTIY